MVYDEIFYTKLRSFTIREINKTFNTKNVEVQNHQGCVVILFAYPSIKYQSFILEHYARENFSNFDNFLFHQDINHSIIIFMQRNFLLEYRILQ